MKNDSKIMIYKVQVVGFQRQAIVVYRKFKSSQ